MKKAMYYETKDINKVKCTLFPHNCIIENSLTGICGVRRNRDGDLYSLNYGKINALAIDPIEKKPLYHFYPGSKT
jgi:pyruvate formate lyase activating enzyme